MTSCKSVQVAFTKNNPFPVQENWTRVTVATDNFDSQLTSVLNASSKQATAADQYHEFKDRFSTTIEASNENVVFTNEFGKFSLLVNDKISLGETVPDEELNVYYANEQFYSSPLNPIDQNIGRPAAILEAMHQYENAEYCVASPYSNLTPAQVVDTEPFAAIDDFHAILGNSELFFWWAPPPRKFELIETGGTKFFTEIVGDVTGLGEVIGRLLDEYLQFQNLLVSLGATIISGNPPVPDLLPNGQFKVTARVTWENAIPHTDQEPIAGYNLYAKNDVDGTWKRMNSELIGLAERSFVFESPTGLFTALQRDELFFAVTSIDVHGNESALSPQIAVHKDKGIGKTNRQISFQGMELGDKILEKPLTNMMALKQVKVRPLQGLRDALANEALFFAVDNDFGDIVLNFTSIDTCKNTKIRIKALGAV